IVAGGWDMRRVRADRVSTTPSRSPTDRFLPSMRFVIAASARLRAAMSCEARDERPTKLANSLRAVFSLIGLLQTQAPICFTLFARNPAGWRTHIRLAPPHAGAVDTGSALHG